jgi:hypothetical protein
MSEDLPPDDVETLYLHKLMELALRHGVQVYWMVMPLVPALHEGRERLGLNASYDRFVSSFRDYPNLTLLDVRRSGYEPSVFVDACHLDYQGAFVLSTQVATVLQWDHPPRTVTLPPYRSMPVDVPLETGRQSKLAILPNAEARR